MDLTLIIDKLVPGADYRRADDLATLAETWVDPRPIPSEAAIKAAWAEYQSAQTVITTRTATRAALRARWKTQPAWMRGPYHDKFSAVISLLDDNDKDAALEMIESIEPTRKITKDAARLTQFNGVKAQFAAAIQNL